jgi:hypothetical protein
MDDSEELVILDEIDIVRDAFIAYLNEHGYKCRKVYDHFVQMDGEVSPVNIWMDNRSIVAYSRIFSLCDPDAFNWAINRVKQMYHWDPATSMWV